MIYKILQIDMLSLYDEINALGWEEASATYPQVKAHLAVSMRGAKGFTPDMFEHYRVVEIVSAPDLESCFALTNGAPAPDAWVVHSDKARSLSVGDIVVESTAKGDTHYMCDPFGFSQIVVTPR